MLKHKLSIRKKVTQSKRKLVRLKTKKNQKDNGTKSSFCKINVIDKPLGKLIMEKEREREKNEEEGKKKNEEKEGKEEQEVEEEGRRNGEREERKEGERKEGEYTPMSIGHY